MIFIKIFTTFVLHLSFLNLFDLNPALKILHSNLNYQSFNLNFHLHQILLIILEITLIIIIIANDITIIIINIITIIVSMVQKEIINKRLPNRME